jgi:hypothetical protein
MEWLPTVIAGVGAVAAIDASRFARKGARGTEHLALIEADRRHVELTPRFTPRCQTTGLNNTEAVLTLTFTEPAGLDQIELTASIRDDDTDRLYRIDPNLTAEQIKAQVWGPYRFAPGVDGADKNGRAPAVVQLNRGQSRRFWLERTLPPPWATNSPNWWEQWADHPVRLNLVARSGSHEPWTVPLDVDVEPQDGESRSAAHLLS